MEPYENIDGHEKVVEFFGRWPSFHDAEVLSIQFNRNHIFKRPGPSLIAKIHVLGMTANINEKEQSKTSRHCVITFAFDNISNLNFSNFNQQNAIFDMHFNFKESANNQPGLKVFFEPSFGVSCDFECCVALVTDIDEGIPEDRVCN